MVGPRGLAFILVCLVLISVKAENTGPDWENYRSRDGEFMDDEDDNNEVEAEDTVSGYGAFHQVFFVSNAEGRDGIFEQVDQGTNMTYYKRMGGAVGGFHSYTLVRGNGGQYTYMYRGTQQADSWVLGNGRWFGERYGVFRAPIEGGGRVPPKTGWQLVVDHKSPDGGASWGKLPNMRVDGFNLKVATAKEMYERSGEETTNGIICKVRDTLWTHMRWKDKEFCDGIKNCEVGLDEPEGCKQPVVVITGSDGRDGLYNRNGRYKQENGHNIIFKKNNRWVIAEGSNQKDAVVLYKSGDSNELPRDGWHDVAELRKNDGRLFGDPVPGLHVVQVPQNFYGNQTETDEGLICKSGETEDWHFLPEGDKRRCNGVCECGTCKDEEDCELHSKFNDTGFLVVRGVEPQQNGVYQLVNDSNGNPQFFRHTNKAEKLIIHQKDGGWALSLGLSPETVTGVLFTSPSWSFGFSDALWKKGEHFVDVMRVSSVSNAFNKTQMLEGDWEEEEGIMCGGHNNERIFIEKNRRDPFFCDRRNNCPKTGIDERSCSVLVNLTFEQPIFSAFGAVGVGVLLFFVFRKSLKGKRKHRRNRKVSERLRRSIDQIVNQARKKKGKEPNSMDVDEEAYKEIHETPGGLRALVGTGYSLLSHPNARHMLAMFIVKEEEKIHGDVNEEAWQECIRRKAGSNKATAAFLDSIDEPGCLKRFKYKMMRVINWLTDNPENLQGRCNLVRSRFKSWVSLSSLPLLSVTLHVLDYIKDGWMANYLFRRLGFINSRCNLLSGLVYVYGASIGVAGVLMAFVFQTESSLLGFDSSMNWCCIAFVRCLLFVLAPFLPIIVIMKAVELKGKKEVLEAMYRDISTDATAKWERLRELDEEEQDVVEALSDLKMVVCSTEAVVQFLLLVIFTFASVLLPSTSGIGLLKDNNSYEWTFLVFSFLTTLVTVNKAILDAMDIQKKRQLDFKQKVILGMSFTFQILSHVFLIVPVGLLALPLADSPADDGSKDASLTVTHASILLVVPIILRWISITALHYCLAENKTRFWDLTKRKRFLHVLANTWVTMPVRINNEREQVHRDKELRWSMGMAGINILVTWAMTSTLIIPEKRSLRFLSSSAFTPNTEFRLVGVLPSLLCHLAGCAFLFLHYKAFHPWRNLFTWQRKKETRDELKEETPCWEEVS